MKRTYIHEYHNNYDSKNCCKADKNRQEVQKDKKIANKAPLPPIHEKSTRNNNYTKDNQSTINNVIGQ